MVTIGVTGHGKSTFLNFLSKIKRFNVPLGHNVASCTEGVSKAILSMKDKTCHLIDTPGLLDTERASELCLKGKSIGEITSTIEEDTLEHLKEAFLLAGKTLNIFLFVYNPCCKWSMEMEVAMKVLEGMISWKHTVLVLTHAADAFDGKTVEERFEELERFQRSAKCPRGYKNLLERTRNRCMIVESKHWSKDEVHYEEVLKQLFTSIESIHTKSEGIENVGFTSAREKVAAKFLEDFKVSKLQRTFSTVAEKYQSTYNQVQAEARQLVPVIQGLTESLKEVGKSLLNLKEKIVRTKILAACTSIFGIITTVFSVVVLNPVALSGGISLLVGGIATAAITSVVENIKKHAAVKEANGYLADYKNKSEAFYNIYKIFKEGLQSELKERGKCQLGNTVKAICTFLHISEEDSTAILDISSAARKLDILQNLKEGNLSMYEGTPFSVMAAGLLEFLKGEDAAEGAARTYALSVNLEKSPDHYLLEAVTMMERERDLIKALGGLTN